MKLIDQYKGLRKEIYILFFGRIVTNLGSMIHPILTLILTQKLGMSAEDAAWIIVLSGIILIPAGILGGKIADRYSKKNCIVVCDIISIVLYAVCAFIPLSVTSVVLITLASACQYMEHPAYTSLVADLTLTKDRERAYSLQYLGANIGLIASPTIAGILFKDFLWLSFLLSAAAIATSTVLIFLRIQDIRPVKETEATNAYQEEKSNLNVWDVLKANLPILLYVISFSLYSAAYQQYGYLMPIDIANAHGDVGSVIYGSVTSVNCIVVVLFTPFFTKLCAQTSHTKKNLIGTVMLLVGYVVFLLMLGNIPFYYVAITLFTFGEIFTTITGGPYISARIPASHRGRINGFTTVMQSICEGFFLWLTGRIYDNHGSVLAWETVFLCLGVALLGNVILIFVDKKRYADLYPHRKK